MQIELNNKTNNKPIEKLSVVRNFTQVIEARDINLMGKELYQFLILYCGFIAHYDINGFKAAYSAPDDFSNVFIRHFDPEHKYFEGCYPCHDEPYKDTDYTKAEIKKEFTRIVEKHKHYISQWAENTKRQELHRLYLKLQSEFEKDTAIDLLCEACGNDYSIVVRKEGLLYKDFSEVCCIFCGQQIKIFRKMEVV